MSAAVKGIEGWELANLDLELFDSEVLEVYGDCQSCCYLSECDYPCASKRRLTPKRGKLVELCCQSNTAGERLAFYALIVSRNTRFIQLREPEHYWATASYIGIDQLPEEVLAELAKHRRLISKEPMA
jgi:hypothetical protein